MRLALVALAGSIDRVLEESGREDFRHRADSSPPAGNLKNYPECSIGILPEEQGNFFHKLYKLHNLT